MQTQGAILMVVVALLGCSCLACPISWIGWEGIPGSGRVIEETYQVSGFTGVELATVGNLRIEVGEKEELRIEAEDNLIEYFEIGVDGGKLKIGNRTGVSLRPTRPVNFYLTVKELDTIVISGSGNVDAPNLAAERLSVVLSGSGNMEMDELDADRVEMRITGSGDLDIAASEAGAQAVTLTGSGDVAIGDLVADKIEIKITGSGSIDILGGEVEEQRVTLTGSGDYQARHLASDEAHVRVTGSGGAAVEVKERLETTILGSGDVHYAGGATVTQSVTGSGDVVRVGP
jgi:hypothetical protein